MKRALATRLQLGSGAALLALASLAGHVLAGEKSDDDEPVRHAGDPDQFAEAVARAEDVMSGVKRGELETLNFRIATDVYTKEVLGELAGSLEGAYYAVDRVLQLPVAKTDRKVQVYFFEHAAQHYQLAGYNRGYYMPPGLLAFYKGKSNTEELLDVLVHEATHAFLHQFIDTGRKLPTWLNEGFATYMGFSLVRGGQIEPGVYYSVQRQVFLNNVQFGAPPAARAAKRVARHIKFGPLLPLEELLSADRAKFYGTLGRDGYDVSWAFVHYLRDGVPEGQTRFPKLVAAYARGLDGAAAFAEAYGTSAVQMESAFHEYVTRKLADPPRPPQELMR